MHLLDRVCLQNWYLIDAIDIDIRGATALVGPTGAGKSSIQDAIQTVITGGNQNRLNLNPSASGRSGRSVLEYCLGMTKDPAEGGKPLRNSCETIIALVFRDEETDEPMTVGIAMSARQGDSREEILSRFIATGVAYSVKDARRREGARETLATWSEISKHLASVARDFEEYKTSGEKFTSDMLKRMRGDSQAPNPKHFLRAFSNALAFKPIYDPTVFIRDYVLEPDNLDIDRVRTSIATWQELEQIIADIEARLRRVVRLSERYRNWGRARLKTESARFASAHAESRRSAHDVRNAKEVYKKRFDELSVERSALQTRRQWVRELDEEIKAKSLIMQASGDGARLRQIEIERQLADRDQADAARRFAQIRQALSMIAQLGPIRTIMTPGQMKAVDAAREALSIMPDGISPQQALFRNGERLQRLVDEVMQIESLDGFLHEQADAIADEVRGLQRETEKLETMLAQSGGGHAILSTQATRLLAELDRKGMQPTPLCDVVEVVEEDWQYAVEALLGRSREAIIVEPDHVPAAFDLMYRNRDQYAGCTLVKSNMTASISLRQDSGSILEAIKTANKHASAFLNVRIGSFRKAEDESELARIDRGVMRNGKTSSGMGLSVQRDLRELVLGRKGRARTSEALRNDLDPLQEVLARKSGLLRLVREAARIIPAAVDVLKNGDQPFHLEHTLNHLRTRIDALQNDEKQSGSDDGGEGLAKQVRDLEEDRALYQKEISEEIEPAVERLQQETATAKAKLDMALQGLRKAIGERRKAWAQLSAEDVQKLLGLDPEIDEPNAATVLKGLRAEIRRGEVERSDPRSFLSSMRTDRRTIADNYDSEVRREQSAVFREMSEYAVNWAADVPQIDHDTLSVGYVWVMAERSRLEHNELRRHKQACEQAADEMRKMLKEDLLARLSEKLVKVHHRLDVLNRLVANHRFTGQTYSFTSSVNQRFARMHDLAMRFGKGDEGVSLADEEVAEAVAELEGMIEGAQGTETLSDYRQYFTFEIVMTDRQGGRTTMSSRAVKGSGGEAQAPFYVAIAASLASAYFPGHAGGRPSGMGLALFDEAFNKLDVPNTQALLNFFRDMGLQLMIAGPEDKRATFTEVLDTIILVNKALDEKSVYVDAEYPGSLARSALASINPDHETFHA